MIKKLNHFRSVLWIFVTVISLLLLSACGNKDEYTIEFETNGGNPIEDISFNINDPITEVPEPTKDGYRFVGWYLDEKFTETLDLSQLDDRKITVYAKWVVQEEVISIIYNTLGGSPNKTIDVDVNQLPEPYAPHKDGFVFKGWYLDEDLTTPYAYEDHIYEDTTLYAKWEEKGSNVLTIVFNQDLTYEFNASNESLPSLDGIVPAYFANHIEGYYLDPWMLYPYHADDQLTNAQTLYARIDDRYYVYYEDITVDQFDQFVHPIYSLKDGYIYQDTRSAQKRESNDRMDIWEIERGLYKAGIQGNIEEILTFYDTSLFLMNLFDGSQVVGFQGFWLDDKYLFDINDLIDLNPSERVIQIMPIGDAYLYLTDQQRVIIDGEIELPGQLKTFDSLDVTEEFNLQVDEELVASSQQESNLSIMTTSGRIFSFSTVLWKFDAFDLALSDLDHTFLEVSAYDLEPDQLIYLYIDDKRVTFLTSQGNFYDEKENTHEKIEQALVLNTGETVEWASRNYIITTEGRILSFNYFSDEFNFIELLEKDVTVDSYKITDNHGYLFIKASNGQIYVNDGLYLANITSSFETYDINFEEMNLYHHIHAFIESNGNIYELDHDFSMSKLTFGFSSFRVDGPYEAGEEVELETYIDETYEMSGYLYQPDAEKPGFIDMPEFDRYMFLYTPVAEEQWLTLYMNDDRITSFKYRLGDVITKEMIEAYLYETEEIDYVVYGNYNMIIELPFVTLDERNHLIFKVYTQMKEDAIGVDFVYASEKSYYGKETYYGFADQAVSELLSFINIDDYEIQGYYTDEAMSTPYNTYQPIEEGLTVYVHVEPKLVNYLTVHINDDIYELPFTQPYYVTPYGLWNILIYKYQLGMPVDNIQMFQDEAMLQEVESLYLETSYEIWLSIDFLMFIEFYEVDILGNIVNDNYGIWNQDEILPYDMLKYILYIEFPYEIDKIYTDPNLENEVFDSEIDLNTHHVFYYTTKYKDGVDVKVHMYDLSETFIETIDVHDRYFGVSYYLTLYGYDEITLYTDPSFDTVYTGDSYDGLELYAKADDNYVNLTIVDVDFNQTYIVEYPYREVLSATSIKAFLIHQNPATDVILMYKDENLVQSASGITLIEDTTIYIKHEEQEKMIPVTLITSGLYEETFTVYMHEDRVKTTSLLMSNYLSKSYYDIYSTDVKMYDTSDFSTEIYTFIPSELDVVYIVITEPIKYTLTFIDSETANVIDSTVIDHEFELNVETLFESLVEIPEQFINQYVIEIYADEALTTRVTDDTVNEDKTYYVVRRALNTYTVTYKFSDSNIDDLVLELSEYDGMYHQSIDQYLYEYYGSMHHINYVLNPLIENETVMVELNVTALYVIEFVYAKDGHRVSERVIFEEGDILEDSLFFGRLFEDPYGYDVYFYDDESMTNGSLTVVVDSNQTYYLKVVRKY